MELAESLDVLQDVDAGRSPVVRIRLAALGVADSPRGSGESLEHIRMLAESENPLPPIVVHRSTMRVVDGMHRFRAAELRGQQEIEVRFFDGDEASSFVLAVRANIMHGLPLSLADRKAAAARIMALYPQWSDRMVASATGLAAKTVAAAGKRPSGDKQQSDSRVGRDGRARPVNGPERRQIAAKLMAENPAASLREVARQAGISPETVRDVRAQKNRGELDSARQSGAGRVSGRESRTRAAEQRSSDIGLASQNGTLALRALRGDPAFRSTDSGRSLLRMLAAFQVIEKCGKQFVDDAPVHCLGRVVDAAQACAGGWQGFADLAERQRQTLSDAAR
jgi:ParB-like chromosome segregation protein Spo0J